MAFPKKIQDPSARLDWLFDLSGWMPEDDYIVEHNVVVPQGVTEDGSSHQDAAIQVWLKDGVKPGPYTITAHFKTNEGRVDERSFDLSIQER